MSKVLSYQQFLESKNERVAKITKEGHYYIIECGETVEKVDTSDIDESDDNSVAERVVQKALEMKATKLVFEGAAQMKGKVMDTMKQLFRNDETTSLSQYVLQGGTDTKHKD